MRRMLAALVLISWLALPANAAEPMSQTFAASPEKVWTTTTSVLRRLGWDIDKADQVGGWINTESRSVDGEDYGVYAQGTRHRLMIQLKAAGAGRTRVTVERALFKRERILWIDKDEPLVTPDQTVEKAVLTAIGQAL